MSWGWGVLLTKCQKQKLKTKSSTEGEIVDVSDFLPNVIWARMFLEAQGFEIKKISFIKTIKVQSKLKRMERNLVVRK